MSAISRTTSSTDALPRFAGTPLAVVRWRRSRALRLSVDPVTGTVRLSMPWRHPLAPALAWVETRREWVEARLAGRPAATPVAPGALIPLEGSDRLVDWSPDRPRRVVEHPDRLEVGGPAETVRPRLLRHLRARALAALDDETRALAAANGLAVDAVSVGDARGRWGSCSADGRIRYSWRLILMPVPVRRAIVAHEVAHLREHHHGPAFHALAERLLGGSHAPATAWLRAHGDRIQRIGRD